MCLENILANENVLACIINIKCKQLFKCWVFIIWQRLHLHIMWIHLYTSRHLRSILLDWYCAHPYRADPPLILLHRADVQQWQGCMFIQVWLCVVLGRFHGHSTWSGFTSFSLFTNTSHLSWATCDTGSLVVPTQAAHTHVHMLLTVMHKHSSWCKLIGLCGWSHVCFFSHLSRLEEGCVRDWGIKDVI